MSEQKVEPSYRRLTEADIPEAQRLRGLAGWNQTDADWRNFLRFEPEGCFAAELGGKLAGTATTIRYHPQTGPGSVGWVGMVLVDPEQRRHGIGSGLLKKCITYLQGRGVETIKLDATPMGRPVYEKLGFVAEYELERCEGTALAVATPTHCDWTVQPCTPQDLPALAAYDAAVFGAQRTQVLEAWFQHWPECAALARRHGQLVGYALARRGASFDQIGPVAGDAPQICHSLFARLLKLMARRKIISDIVSANQWSARIAQECQLQTQRPFLRMALGANSAPGQRVKTLAIACPELG